MTKIPSYDSPEKSLIKIHIIRKLWEMESRIAVAVSILPCMGATTLIYMTGEL